MEIENIQQNLLSSQLVSNLRPQSSNSIASLTNSLIQALQNKDLDIIKFIFSNTDQNMITDTLINFNNQEMFGKFLEICNSMIDSFPNDTEHVLSWLYTFLTLKQSELRSSRLLVGSTLLTNNYLKVKTKTITPLLDVKHKLEFLLATNGERILSNKKGFGEALVTIDERMGVNNEDLIENHKQFNKKNNKNDDIDEGNEAEEQDADEESDNMEEEEEELMYDENENERKGFENDDPMDEEDAELEKELERYEKREKQLKTNKKSN